MRQLKFRAFDTVMLSMIQGHSISLDSTGGVAFLEVTGQWQEDTDSRFIIQQFTGLTDKNGKDIYEGDVLNGDDLGEYNYVVEWVFAGFQLVTYLKPESGARGISNGINQGYFEDAEGLEIIGNIHEHAHLLTNP